MTVKKIVFISILSLLAIFIIVTVVIPTMVMKKEMMNYLVEEKGYSKSDIKSIKRWFGGLPRKAIFVSFKNEPHIEYIYTVLLNRNPSVEQLAFRISPYGRRNGFKSSDFEYRNLMHYDYNLYFR